MRVEAQLDLLGELSEHFAEFPFTDEPCDSMRYHCGNDYFGYGDAIILYSMLRHLRASRVMEIGSGYSSALMLDVNQTFLSQSIEFTFIDPFPSRVQDLFHDGDEARVNILAQPVQDVPLTAFECLERNDLLFVDSSHVAKMGSDLNDILFRILPVLQPGVVIHFHDVFWPFEYPMEWILEGRAWNEAYVLRAFMQYNHAFEFLYFNSFMAHRLPSDVAGLMPRALPDPGGSVYLRRL